MRYPSEGNSISRRKRIFFYCLAFTLCIALILGSLEITMRSLYSRDITLDWLQWHPTRLYVNNPHLPDVFWDTEWNVNSLGLRGPEIGPKEKQRILCLGYSSTFGYRVDFKDSYPMQLQALLPQYEVINGGTFGYSSYQGLQLLRELGDFIQPDIVTINFGYNDRRYVVRPEWQDGEESFQYFYNRFRLHDRLSTSRFYQVLMQSRFKSQLKLKPPVTALVPRVNTLQYRKNLEAMIAYCQSRGIEVVLIALGDNPEQALPVERGVVFMYAREYEQALALFDEARLSKSEDARVMGTYYMALALQALGRLEEADAIAYGYHFAYYFPGVIPIITSHSYFDVLQDLSVEQNLPLILFRKIIKDESAYYLDECHLKAEGYRVLAENLAEVIAEMK